MTDSFADVLGHYVAKSLYSRGQLANLSGVSKRTICNWLDGIVKKPYHWQDVVRVALVLHLNESQTNEVLRSAKQCGLTELRQRELTADDAALLSHWPVAVATPFQAIPRLSYFVGREQMVADIKARLLNGRSISIFNLKGMGGIGKTSLAAYLAYELRPHFPDGVLWGRLDTTDTMTLLASFAMAYGQDVTTYPDIESRVGAVRSILADKQALIILDNAENTAQVRPLLPPTTGKTAVLITSRTDLGMGKELEQVELPPFSVSAEESLALFAQLLDPDLVAQEKASLQQIAHLLGHLPLAIAIAAANLAFQAYPNIPLYLQQVQDQAYRLQALQMDNVSVHASFDLSYQSLTPELQRFFASLSAFGGEDFDLPSVVAVTQTPLLTANENLNVLYRFSLLQAGRNGRYRLHPLLHDYAKARLTSPAPLQRMMTYFVEYALARAKEYTALDAELGHILNALQYALESRQSQPVFSLLAVLYDFFEVRGLYQMGEGWLMLALQLAQSEAHLAEEAQITRQLGHFTYKQGHIPTAQTLLLRSAQLAAHNHLPAVELESLTQLGVIAYFQSAYEKAQTYWLNALSLAQVTHDELQQARIQSNLALIANTQGNLKQAIKYVQSALSIFRAHNDTRRINIALINLGVFARIQGDYSQAKAFFEEAVAYARQAQHQECLGNSLHNLGYVAFLQGDWKTSLALMQESLETAQKSHDVIGMSIAYQSLAEIKLALGRWDEVEADLNESLRLAEPLRLQRHISAITLTFGQLACCHQEWGKAKAFYAQALAIVEEIQHFSFKVDILNALGNCLLACQEVTAAQQAFNEALAIAQKKDLEGVAMALYGQARVAAWQGQESEAIQTGQESLALLTRMGHYKAQEVQNWLNAQRRPVLGV